MAHSQPRSFTVSDIPKKKIKKKYSRSLPISQRIENRIRNNSTTTCNAPPPPSASPKGIVVKLPPMQSNIDIYEILPQKTAYQERLPPPTKHWIHSIINQLNSHKKKRKKQSPHNDSNITIYTLSTDLKLNRKCYQYDHFVSLLNVIIAACFKFEFLSHDFTNFISDYNVDQFRKKAFTLFKQKWHSSDMNHLVHTEQLHDLFVTLFNSPLFILDPNHFKDICSQNLSNTKPLDFSIPNITKHNIDGLDGYKTQSKECEGKYITITSFNNAGSWDEDKRNCVAAEFQSVIDALKKNRDKIGLSIFYSVNNVDPEHFPWCYIIKFKKDMNHITVGAMPLLEEEEQKAEKEKENRNIENTKKVQFIETIIIDLDESDDDIEIHPIAAKAKRTDKDENDDDDDDDDDIAMNDETNTSNRQHHTMNGYSTKHDKDTSDEEQHKRGEVNVDNEPLGTETEIATIIAQDNAQTLAETFAETQMNHDAALYDTVDSDKTERTASPQRVSSQPRLPQTVPPEDDDGEIGHHEETVEISLNMPLSEPMSDNNDNNHNNNDLDATLIDDDDDDDIMTNTVHVDHDHDILSLSYAVSENASPIKQKSAEMNDNELPQTILPDTEQEQFTENSNNNRLLAHTMVVDDNEESLLLEIEDDTLEVDANKGSDGIVMNNGSNRKQVMDDDEMSLILSNHDGNNNNNNNAESLELDLHFDAEENDDGSVKDKERNDLVDLRFSDESESVNEKQNKKKSMKEDRLDDDDETEDEDEDGNEKEKENEGVIEQMKNMGFDEGLVRFVLDDIAPGTKDISTLCSLCAVNTDYYNKNKNKIQTKKRQKQKQNDNKKYKRGKKRKRGQSEDDSENNNDDDNDAPPNKKQKFSRNVPNLRSTKRKKKKQLDEDFIVYTDDEDDNDESISDEFENNRNNKNKPLKRSRRIREKKKKKTKKKKKKKVKLKDQSKPKNVKETDSKLFNDNIRRNADIFKTKECQSFEADTESDSDDIDEYFPN